MTKVIVSATLLTLYDEGFLGLDDLVDKYIPEFTNLVYVSETTLEDLKTTPAKSKPTLRQLLTHTAGTTAYFFHGSSDEHLKTWDSMSGQFKPALLFCRAR